MAKIKAQYNVAQSLELSVFIDDVQSFVKSGYGYYDHVSGKNVVDNRSELFNYLSGVHDMPEISDDQKIRAQKIREHFKETLVAKKLMGTLSDFEQSIMNSISNDLTDGFGISVIASLPNSFRVASQRQALEEWFEKYRNVSEFVGKIGERRRFEVTVRDVKFIAKLGIHLVTCIDTDDNIVKFFYNKEPDISGLLENKKLVLTGKVKTHDVSKFSQCKETVLNYIKIQEKP
jgi:hypothetical protein